MLSGRQALYSSGLFAAAGMILLTLGADLLWSAIVFVLSFVFLGFYLRESYLVLRRREPEPPADDPPQDT